MKGAFAGVNNLYGGNIVEIAKQRGYSKENIYILNDDLESVRKESPATYANLMSCRHHRDHRSPLEYAKDLVASWLIEDDFIARLRDVGGSLILSGADKGRQILSAADTNAQSDYEIELKGNTYPLEFMCDYGGYWKKYNKIDLRDSKYKKLCDEEAIFIGIDLVNELCIPLSFVKNGPRAIFIASHFPYGGKPAYSIPIGSIEKLPLAPKAILDALWQLV